MIEKTIEVKELPVGCFLDIEDAFDNTGSHCITHVALTKGATTINCNSNRVVLEKRIIKEESHISFTIAVNELLVKLCENGFTIIVILMRENGERLTTNRS